MVGQTNQLSFLKGGIPLLRYDMTFRREIRKKRQGKKPQADTDEGTI
jgi:hypothetical protein